MAILLLGRFSHLKLEMSCRSEGLVERPTVDGVHYLKRTIGVFMFEAFKDKIHISCDGLSVRFSERGSVNTICLIGITQPDEGIKGEGRIPDPRRSVIPVPLAADKLWEGECRTSHDGTSRFVNEQLQGQCTPVHGLLPRSRVGGSMDPVDPVLVCGLRRRVVS